MPERGLLGGAAGRGQVASRRRSVGTVLRRRAGWLLFLGWLACAEAGAGVIFDAGFLASGDQDLEGRDRWRALGPLVEHRLDPDGGYALLALRPFFVQEVAGPERMVRDFLWPLAQYRRWHGEADWRVLNVWYHDFDVTTPESRYRFWLLPVLFLGRDAGGENYAALFPVAGTLREFLGRDEITFLLFPLYSRSRLNDLRTWNVLWPLISRTTGEGVDIVRVFPLYGRNAKAGEWRKEFVLWPLWTSVRYEREGARGGGFLLLPLYGHLKMENQESWMVLPPFFRWTTSARQRAGYFPWPFVQVASGAVEKFYLWPLFGHRATPGERQAFWLWPFITRRESEGRGEMRERWMVFPLLYTETRCRTVPEEAATPEPVGRYFKLWPLWLYEREEAQRRWQALALWPARHTPPVERNWEPLWTLLSYRRTAAESEAELLWGLWRRRTRVDGAGAQSLFPLLAWECDPQAGQRAWSVLKGLLGYTRTPTNRTYRLLYVLRWRTES